MYKDSINLHLLIHVHAFINPAIKHVKGRHAGVIAAGFSLRGNAFVEQY